MLQPTHKKSRFVLSLLALCVAVGVSTSASWAEDPSALEMTADGAESVVEGTVEVISTPILFLEQVSDGQLDEAILSTIKTPISGVTSATTGVVQVVSGAGKGVGDITAKTFGAIGNTASKVKTSVKSTLSDSSGI